MNWYKKIKIAEVIGEWWITNHGEALYADGDLGDYNHEAHVRETIASSYFEMDRIDSPDLYDIMNMSEEELIEVGMEPDEITVIQDRMDPREFAMKKWKWIRVADKYVQAWTLDSGTLGKIADGLYEAYGMDAFKNTFVLENLSTGKNYSPVPWNVIEKRDPMLLREFQEFDPMALGEKNKSWYKQAMILLPTETLDEPLHKRFEAIRLQDGRIIYDEYSNHWELYYQHNHIVKRTNIESIGWLSGDGVYEKKYIAQDAWRYLNPHRQS